MVDNRSAGFFGVGSMHFKGSNANASRMSDEKNGQGGEYFAQEQTEQEENEKNDSPYVDRSAQLRATLNSLAMMNVAGVIKGKKSPNDKK